ncbi:DUF2341 domain-containing protein [Thermococcus sp. Bubb.Bath]|uniref:DUF2341 domain-containing protein n=1 Tax=Thermococcus sp. Bubb.Bath TaxID=1638242 RepID=UPI001438BAB7|nr:DUF2341 domain-containing protein [Thermococcus sp. Bubb.Bath]NJF25542.1 DUF2341 domain-containing protein [Thermococcus sp. Bubb.Bath]
MEARMMRRRGFLINSAVLVLLIPLLLLTATYTQVHYQIINSQSENMELEKLNWAVNYLDTDLRNTLQISGKRAILAMVNYTVSNEKFLSKANVSMRNLMINGKIEGYTSPLMGNQTLLYWFNTASNELIKRGLILRPSGNLEDSIDMEIVPLTSFKVAVKARIKNITLMDMNGKVIYQGSLPVRGYLYTVIDLDGVEDPVYAISTNGQYHRMIQPCSFSYPEFGEKPVKWLTGAGNSSVTHLVGTYGENILYSNDTIWSNSPEAKLVNPSVNPLELFRDGDRGYLYFGNVSVPVIGNNWAVSSSYKYRVNFTVDSNNFKPNSLTLLIMDTTSVRIEGKTLNKWVAHTSDKASILIYDSNGDPVNFWIEYWDSNSGKLWLWMKTTDVNKYSLYVSDDPSLETRGDPSGLFYLIDDFLYKNTDLWDFQSGTVSNGWYTFNNQISGSDTAISKKGFKPPFFVRWGMNTTNADAGVGIYRPPQGGGENYIDVVVRYGKLTKKSVYWPYNTTGTSSVSSLNDLRYSWKKGYTRYIYSLSDAQTAKSWLDSKLAKINGTTVEYKDYQVPIYLNVTTIQGINANGGKAAIKVVDENGNPLPFWIEYWNDNGALIWVKVNLSARYYTGIGSKKIKGTLFGKTVYSIYKVKESRGTLSYESRSDTYYKIPFVKTEKHTYYYITRYSYAGAHIKILYNTGSETRGDGDKVFEFFDDFNEPSLDTSKWNIGGDSSYISLSNGVLTLNGDSDPSTSDVWLWTRKTFPYYSYVVGMEVKVSSLAAQGWLWYLDNTNWAWMEDVYPKYKGRKYKGTYGHLYDFNVGNGNGNYYEDGGGYLTDEWTHIEVAVDDYHLIGDHYADMISYQNQSGPFVGTWSGNTTHVSYYDGFWDDIYAQNNTAIGLAQFMGSTSYDFIYVRKYLDLNSLTETVKKHEAQNKPTEYEATGSATQLALWKNWEELAKTTDGTSGFNRYELNVSSTRLNLTRITSNAHVGYNGDFSGSWNVSIVGKGVGSQSFDWIIVGPPYVTSGVKFGTPEGSGLVVWKAYASAAFDLQPFLSCLVNDRYFGLYDAPSFFERLEGKLDPASTGKNGEYWEAAKKMQEELGIAKDGSYYPIGLVSFIYYPSDDDLTSALKLLEKDPNSAIGNAISFADYYWLGYYFKDKFAQVATSPKAYRMWGISMGTGDYAYLSGVGFLIDNSTAETIMGKNAWKYLIYGG